MRPRLCRKCLYIARLFSLYDIQTNLSSAPSGADSSPTWVRHLFRSGQENLNQPQAHHAGMTILADDDVIMDADAERARDADDRLGTTIRYWIFLAIAALPISMTGRSDSGSEPAGHNLRN
jgi:hypothetical protein